MTSLILLVCMVVVVAHSDPGGHDMGGMEGADSAMSDAMSICLAVLGVGSLMVIGGVIISRRRRFPSFPTDARTVFTRPVAVRLPGFRARAGPSVLQVFRN